MKYALEVEDVSKVFVSRGKRFSALSNVDLKIKKGEIFGLLGPNGAGKTTLINIITGVLLPSTGAVTILGESNKNRAVFDRINGVSAETYFHWAFKSIDILRFYSKLYGVDKKVAEKRIREIIDLVEIKDIINSKFSWLSTGERMRLALAKALVNDPELLLLDEPTLGLDPNIAIKIRKVIKKISVEKKVTVLLTSHYMQEVEQLSNRVAFINKGQIVDIGETKKVKVKHFNTYDLKIKLREVKQKQFLQKLGFKIIGKNISKEMSMDEDLSIILTQLHNKGLKVSDVEVKRPSLEDYFIKLAK